MVIDEEKLESLLKSILFKKLGAARRPLHKNP